MIGHVMHNVPRKRQVATLWVNSIYLVVALFTTFSIVLPVCSNFVWLFFKVRNRGSKVFFVKKNKNNCNRLLTMSLNFFFALFTFGNRMYSLNLNR